MSRITPNGSPMTTEDLEERAARILRGASDGSPIGDLTAALDAVERLRADLAQCYCLTGADPSGGMTGDINEDWRLAPYAVDEVRRLRAECDEAHAEVVEAHRTLARIVEKIGPDYVSMEGGPPMAVDLDPLEAVSGLIEQATAHADEASRARGEAARLREEVARLRAVVRS